MVLEAKAGFESQLAARGNAIAATRLKARFNQSDWLNEQLGGVSQYFSMRALAKRIDSDWPSVQAELEAIRRHLLVRGNMVANITADDGLIDAFRPQLAGFIRGLPQAEPESGDWLFAGAGKSEGLTFPGQVNYVAKGADLVDLGFTPNGATSVVIKHLNTTYMWDRIRVQGGAYGGGASFDQFSGSFAFTSYRDPNLLETIDNYDQAAAFLRARSSGSSARSTPTGCPMPRGSSRCCGSSRATPTRRGNSGARRSSAPLPATSRRLPTHWSR
jgi:Zn-dependent M16 (insulinase) family peptidase